MKRWKKFDLDEMIAADQAERAAARQYGEGMGEKLEELGGLLEAADELTAAYLAGVLEGMRSAMMMQRSA